MKKAEWVYGKPVIENRIVHIDLKGPKIPFESFINLIRLLARWGINAVLVEYEHRFPYLPLKNQFPASERYTKKQLKTLIQIASDNGIQWIPLIQTFGHLEYLSRIKGTQVLFENPEYPQQICPLKKQARKYIEDLLEIICEFHGASRYIHTGQDETHQLGFCPECKKAVEEKEKIEFYLEHARWVWNIVKRNGRTPLFWADMFFTENRLELLKEIDENVIPVVWEYGDIEKISQQVLIGGVRPTILAAKNPFRAKATCLPVSQIEKDGNFFEDLDKKIKRIVEIDKKTGYPESFSQTRIISKYRKNCWTACATYNCSDMLFSPSFIRGVLNPLSMIDVVKGLKIKGIIATNWARAHSYAPVSPPWTVALYNIAHFAAASYSGKTQPSDIKEISKIVCCEIGMPVNFGRFSLDDIVWVISSNASGPGFAGRIKNLQNTLLVLKQGKVEGIFGEGLVISVEAELLWTKLLFLQEEARWWNPMKKEIPRIIFIEMKKRFNQICREINSLEKRAAAYYIRYVGDRKSFKTWWNGLFGLDIYTAKKALELLSN